MWKTVKKKPTPPLAVPVVAISVIFGVAAGFIGGLLAVDYLYPTAVSEPPNYLLTRSIQSARIGDGLVRPSGSVEVAARAAVLFYDPKGEDPQDQLFWPAEALAAGVTLTSDGWLISHRHWPEGSDPEEAVAVIGNRAYDVSQVVSDPRSGVVFIKIEASNLPVIGFNEADWLMPGESLFGFDANLGPRRLDVVGYGPKPVTDDRQAVVSADVMNQFLRLPAVSGLLPGSMVLDNQGQVVAIFAGNDDIGSSAVPVGDFSNQLEPIVRDKAVDRPWLGVRYLDLARVVGGQERRAGHDVGALLLPGSNGTTPAVQPKSPAAEVGLRAGDLIMAVNGEPVSAKRSLAEIIGEYQSGDTVRLAVLRGAFTGQANWQNTGRPGAEIELAITLGRYPTISK